MLTYVDFSVSSIRIPVNLMTNILEGVALPAITKRLSNNIVNSAILPIMVIA